MDTLCRVGELQKLPLQEWSNSILIYLFFFIFFLYILIDLIIFINFKHATVQYCTTIG